MLRSLISIVYIFLAAFFLLSCEEPTQEDALQQAIYRDPHSYARAWEARVDHLSLDLKVDFEQEKLVGMAVLRIDREENAKTLHLDTRNLDIQSISVSDDSLHLRPIDIQTGRMDSILGEELLIPLEENTRFVHIQYQTNPGADALQFLPPTLTTGSGPFLLTQSQAINARTWVPIQDSPGIRFTYDAKIQVPAHLLALMSATNPQKKNLTGIYTFKMEQPIPAYLLALNVGDLEFRSLGDRVGVYAEPSIIDSAAYEFADLSKMMAIAEQLYGPYRWERYDVVVQPPSFPFGGMENPRLTFATPTILAGDRSLVSLVAHELAHSWSGNLVTNATWNDFWLNEGFTVYFEYRIMEALKGRDYSEMLARISYEDLIEEVQSLPQGSPDTRLALNLTGRNPDNIPAIPYDKGYYFLRHVEELVGRAAFDTFLVDYFNRNA
ncbi:MAG: M1 family aminopeptidase/hydrolase, partial [Bacteroidota bacterium]